MSKRFWAGLIGGTLFGMLFAKKSGKEVRMEISAASKKDGWKGGVETLGKELGEMGHEFVDAVDKQPRVHEFLKDLKKTAGTVKKEVKSVKKVARKLKDMLPDEDD